MTKIMKVKFRKSGVEQTWNYIEIYAVYKLRSEENICIDLFSKNCT